jgi:transcriptional/translational regulatory protein YebC/TACO1
LTGPQVGQMIRLMESIEEQDDVQHVYANFDFDEKDLQTAAGS